MAECPECGKEISNPANMTRHMNGHARKAGAGDVPRETSSGPDETAAGDAYGHPDEETPGGAFPPGPGDPAPPPKGFKGTVARARAAVDKAKDKAKVASKPTSGKRESLAEYGGALVSWVGRRVEASGEAYLKEGRYNERPVYSSVMVGRSFDLVSPVAGELMDDAIEGTIVDKMVQPFARRSTEWEKVFRVLEIPVLCGMAERNPAALRISVEDDGTVTLEGPLAQPLYRSMLVFLEAHADVVVKKKKDDEARIKKIEEAFGEVEGDPVLLTIVDLFRPVAGVPTPAQVP